MNFTKVNEDIVLINQTINNINVRFQQLGKAKPLSTIALMRQPPQGLIIPRDEIVPILRNVNALKQVIISYSLEEIIKDVSASFDSRPDFVALIKETIWDIDMLNANMS